MPSLLQTYLMTPDLERSRTFYEEGLTLTPNRVGETSVAYRTGECELKLQADFDPETLDTFNLSPPGEIRGDGLVIVLEVEQPLETVYQHITALDDDVGTALTEPREVPWGERMFIARDPNGYTCEIRSAEPE